VRDTGRLQERDRALQQAKALRTQKRVPEALAALAELERVDPGFSRLYHERAHCHIALGQAPEAISALQEAVRLNPTQPASWDMLRQLYQMRGDAGPAAQAAQQLAILNQLPQAVLVANSLFVDGDLASADAVIRDYLDQDRTNVGALRLLARICWQAGAVDEAETLLQSVLDLADDFHAARLDYAIVLSEQFKHQQARQQAERLVDLDPNNRAYLKQYCAASIGLGDYEPVIDTYERLLAGQALSEPDVADLRVWRGNALKTVGRPVAAIGDYHAALKARPDYGLAWFSLSNLKTYRFSDSEIDRMRLAECQPRLEPLDQIYLCFALGKALEDRGDYAGSWHYYARGNDLRRSTGHYQPEATKAHAQCLEQVFTAEALAARQNHGLGNPVPIFIVGLPRSGSTLVEQILASHTLVEGTQELTEIDRYVAEICGRDPKSGLPLRPEALLDLSPGKAQALGERYLAETKPYRRLGRAYFTDKMPNNFWHIGLIQIILPQAIIIDVRREPMACCFSNFKQLFGGANQTFSYGLKDLANHYDTYLDLMQHWNTVLPGRVLRLHYEDLVEDLEGNVRRLLAHCGLGFEPNCLLFHQTERSVRTPSSEQVRQPVGQEGLMQWRHYEPWLAPLQDALGQAIARYRD